MSSWFETLDLSALQEQIKASVDHASKLVEEMNLDNMQQEQEAEEEAKIFHGGDLSLAKPGKDVKTPPRDEQGGDSSAQRKKGSKRAARVSNKKTPKAKASSTKEKSKPVEPSENFGFFAGGAVWDDPLFASYEAPVDEEPVNEIISSYDREVPVNVVSSRENGMAANEAHGLSFVPEEPGDGPMKGHDVGNRYEKEEADDGDDDEGSDASSSDGSRRSAVSKRYNFNEDFLKDISDCESEADVRDERLADHDDIYFDDKDEDGIEGTPSKRKGEGRSRSGSSASAGGSDITSQIWSNLRGLYSSSAAPNTSSTAPLQQAPKQGDGSAPSITSTGALNQPVRPRFLFFDRVEEEVDLDDDPILKQVKKNASSGSYFDPNVMPKIFNDFLKPFKQPVAPKSSEAGVKGNIGASSGGKDLEMGPTNASKLSGSAGSSGTSASGSVMGAKQVAMLIFTACAALFGLLWRIIYPALGYLKALCSRLYLQISTNVDSKGERINFQSRMQNIGWCTWSHVSSKNGIATLMALLMIYSFSKLSSMGLV